MNLTFTRHSSYRRLDRIERYAMQAQQRLLERAINEINAHLIIHASQYGLGGTELLRLPESVRAGGFVHALDYAGDKYWGYEWADFRDLLVSGAFGHRLPRIIRRAEELDKVLEIISEEVGTRYSESAADCAAWQADREFRGDWEARNMERWVGD